jgi:hypothetical protein
MVSICMYKKVDAGLAYPKAIMLVIPMSLICSITACRCPNVSSEAIAVQVPPKVSGRFGSVPAKG